MKKNKTAVSAATSNKVNLSNQVESKFGHGDSINKWWVLKQFCKGILVVMTPYKAPLTIWSFYQDVKNGKHREQRPFRLSDTRAVWGELIDWL